jgi:hypothetical protein
MSIGAKTVITVFDLSVVRGSDRDCHHPQTWRHMIDNRDVSCYHKYRPGGASRQPIWNALCLPSRPLSVIWCAHRNPRTSCSPTVAAVAFRVWAARKPGSSAEAASGETRNAGKVLSMERRLRPIENVFNSATIWRPGRLGASSGKPACRLSRPLRSCWPPSMRWCEIRLLCATPSADVMSKNDPVVHCLRLWQPGRLLRVRWPRYGAVGKSSSIAFAK